MASVLDTIKVRSSIRAYKEDKLTDEQLKTILEAGLLAPTARNEQELHFSVVDGNSPVIQEMNAELGRNLNYSSPTFIVISGRDDFSWSAVDAGIAVENMHLAAIELGLGSVIIGIIAGLMRGEKKAHYNEMFAIPEGYSYQIALAVGVPATEKAPHAFDYEKNVTIL